MVDLRNKILLIFACVLLGAMVVPAQDTGITWHKMEEAQQLAKENGKKVLVYAEASWCSYCRQMEQEVLSKTDIQTTMDNYFYPVRINIESDQEIEFNGRQITQMEFAGEMRVSGTPTFFFIDSEGSVIGAQPGFIPEDIYQSMLKYVGTDTYNEMKFNEYLNQ